MHQKEKEPKENYVGSQRVGSRALVPSEVRNLPICLAEGGSEGARERGSKETFLVALGATPTAATFSRSTLKPPLCEAPQ